MKPQISYIYSLKKLNFGLAYRIMHKKKQRQSWLNMNKINNALKWCAQLAKENVSAEVLSAQACQQLIISLTSCSTLKTQSYKVLSALIPS